MQKKKKKWSASLICADMLHLKEDLTSLLSQKIDFLHFDVMDGNFVPRLGLHPELLKEIKSSSTIPVEVHLMIKNPELFIPAFAEAGADVISVHYESCPEHIYRIIECIKKYKVKTSLAFNPATSLDVLKYLIDDLQYILLMGINPGITGQSLKPFTVQKVKELKQMIQGKNIEIIIDGGVTLQTANLLFDAGADILVGGSQTIFRDNKNIDQNMQLLKNILMGAVR